MIPSMSAPRAVVDERPRRLGVRLALGPGAAGVVGHGLRQQADQAGGGAVVGGDRQVERQDAVAERRAGRPRARSSKSARVVVELGDHDGPRHADGGALLPEHPGRAVDAVDGRDDEQRASAARSPARRSPTKSA